MAWSDPWSRPTQEKQNPLRQTDKQTDNLVNDHTIIGLEAAAAAGDDDDDVAVSESVCWALIVRCMCNYMTASYIISPNFILCIPDFISAQSMYRLVNRVSKCHVCKHNFSIRTLVIYAFESKLMILASKFYYTVLHCKLGFANFTYEEIIKKCCTQGRFAMPYCIPLNIFAYW